MKRVFVSDCDGPIGKNNVALDLSAHFVPEGDRIYSILSAYDYAHAVFPNRQDYTIGNTPKLVLPFLLAFDADNQKVEDFLYSHLAVLRGSRETLTYLRRISNAFIVSTSYEHYIRALCRSIGFPLENTYCTKINLDEFRLSGKEKSKLKSYAWEIGGMPRIQIPHNAQSLRELSNRDQKTVKRLDKIIWKDIAKMCCKRVFSDRSIPNTVEKANAVFDIANTHTSSLENVMYVGDSISDLEALNNVKNGGGFTVSLNGDEAAVKSSEVAILSDNNLVLCVLADLFLRFGKAEALKIAGNWDRDTLWRSSAEPAILDKLFELPSTSWAKVFVVSKWNMDAIVKQSTEFRKTVPVELVNKPA